MRELKTLKQEDLIFYDIETAPVVKNLKPKTPLYDSWEYKVNKQGEMTQNEVIESYSKEAGLNPEFAKIISIVVGKIVKGKVVLITFDDENEVDLLNKFNSLLERNHTNRLVGFVNIGFDSPFIFKRMIINGITPNDKIDSSGLKPWEVEEIDLAKIWQGTSFTRASLINLAVVFGLPSPKEEISGADVGRVYWEDPVKNLPVISAYCRRDVHTTVNIFRKMILEEPLELDTDTTAAPEPEKKDLLTELMEGASYTKARKDRLILSLNEMSPEEREKTFTILDAVTSTARGKKTKMTKAHVKSLKEMFNES